MTSNLTTPAARSSVTPTVEPSVEPTVAHGWRGRRTLPALLALVAVAVLGGAIAWSQLGTGTDTTPAPTAPYSGAYSPGGSVYDSQVPAAAWLVPYSGAYSPGGSVYDSQVPAAARH